MPDPNISTFPLRFSDLAPSHREVPASNMIKIHWFYEIKCQQILKCINQMNFLVIFIVKHIGIEILNNGSTVPATLTYETW